MLFLALSIYKKKNKHVMNSKNFYREHKIVSLHVTKTFKAYFQMK